VDGLLLSILKKGDPRVAELKKNQIPFVLINSEEKGVPCVNHDARPGMETAFSHLSEFGHRRVGFVCGDMYYLNAVERRDIALALAREHRMEISLADGNFSRTSGYYAAGKLLIGKNRPTAIITSSDRESLGVMEYCRDHKIIIPSDLSLISFDDFDATSLVRPFLSAVNNPVKEASMEAAYLVSDIIEGKQKKAKTIRLKTCFIARESTGPCKK
jgi:LacI family transcriptional regulator